MTHDIIKNSNGNKTRLEQWARETGRFRAISIPFTFPNPLRYSIFRERKISCKNIVGGFGQSGGVIVAYTMPVLSGLYQNLQKLASCLHFESLSLTYTKVCLSFDTV